MLGKDPKKHLGLHSKDNRVRVLGEKLPVAGEGLDAKLGQRRELTCGGVGDKDALGRGGTGGHQSARDGRPHGPSAYDAYDLLDLLSHDATPRGRRQRRACRCHPG